MSNICCGCSDLDPPDDRDLRCETRDLTSVECTWTAGKALYNVPKIENSYHLHEMSSKDKYVHSASVLLGIHTLCFSLSPIHTMCPIEVNIRSAG